MGPWSFVKGRLYERFDDTHQIHRVSRYESGSPATGSHAVHAQEQAQLLARGPRRASAQPSGKPTTASSWAIASAGSTTLIVVMPMAAAGLRFTPRSSRNTTSAGSTAHVSQASS